MNIFLMQILLAIGMNLMTLDPKAEIETPAPPIDNSQITIEVFSDFQCPYCAKHEKNLEIIQEKYPDIKIVYRNFPLKKHSLAQKASLAEICTEEQGKNMRSRLFKNPVEENFLSYAEELELDTEAFVLCLENKKTQEKLEEDILDGKIRGVKATPTSFIVKRKIVGAIPLENLEKIIRDL